MRWLPTVLLMSLGAPAWAAAPAPGGASGGGEQSEPELPAPTPRKSHRKPRFSGSAVSESELRKEPVPRPSGDIYIYSPNWREEVRVNIYNPDGSFNQDSLRELSRLFRCRRTDTEKALEPHLFEILSSIQDHFG